MAEYSNQVFCSVYRAQRKNVSNVTRWPLRLVVQFMVRLHFGQREYGNRSSGCMSPLTPSAQIVTTMISLLRLIVPLSAQNSLARGAMFLWPREIQVLRGKTTWRVQKSTIQRVSDPSL